MSCYLQCFLQRFVILYLLFFKDLMKKFEFVFVCISSSNLVYTCLKQIKTFDVPTYNYYYYVIKIHKTRSYFFIKQEHLFFIYVFSCHGSGICFSRIKGFYEIINPNKIIRNPTSFFNCLE